MIDVKNPSDGIKELRSIDPRKIKKAREIKNILRLLLMKSI